MTKLTEAEQIRSLAREEAKNLRKRQRVSHAKTAEELKVLSRRQALHEKANTKQFTAISDAIKSIPTQEVILSTISDTIKVVVNGKIDKISEKVDMVGEHLKKQDSVAEEQGTAIKELSKKIAPIDGAKNWLNDLGKIILYVGAIALAVEAVVQILQFTHIIK